MSNRLPWWRKPHDKDEDNEDDEKVNEKEKMEKRERYRRAKDKLYGDAREDWLTRQDRRFSSPFDDEFDTIFRGSPFTDSDDIFKGVERDIEEMHERMDRIFGHAMEGRLEKPSIGGPFVYGFSMRTGSDGIPHVQEFGNVSPDMMRKFRASQNLTLPGPGDIKSEMSDSLPSSREPLTDIIEHDDHYTITLELPGIEKKDINLEIEDNMLMVDVNTDIRKYFKRLPLPSEVEPKSIAASFNNGVLDVNINRSKSNPKKGKKIKIK